MFALLLLLYPRLTSFERDRASAIHLREHSQNSEGIFGLIGRKRLFASFLVFSKMKASGRECPVSSATAHPRTGA